MTGGLTGCGWVKRPLRSASVKPFAATRACHSPRASGRKVAGWRLSRDRASNGDREDPSQPIDSTSRQSAWEGASASGHTNPTAGSSGTAVGMLRATRFRRCRPLRTGPTRHRASGCAVPRRLPVSGATPSRSRRCSAAPASPATAARRDPRRGALPRPRRRLRPAPRATGRMWWPLRRLRAAPAPGSCPAAARSAPRARPAIPRPAQQWQGRGCGATAPARTPQARLAARPSPGHLSRALGSGAQRLGRSPNRGAALTRSARRAAPPAPRPARPGALAGTPTADPTRAPPGP